MVYDTILLTACGRYMLMREAKLQGVVRSLFKAFLRESATGPCRDRFDSAEATFSRAGPSLHRTHQEGRGQSDAHDHLEDLQNDGD